MPDRVYPRLPGAIEGQEMVSGADLLVDAEGLFAEELDGHLSHAAAHTLSTLFTASCSGCWCTISCVCTFVDDTLLGEPPVEI